MAVESGRLERELEQLLDVERFDPPESFREHALAGDPALYRDADADFEGFWERRAAELDWFEPWNDVLDWSDPPFAKWLVGGMLNASHN